MEHRTEVKGDWNEGREEPRRFEFGCSDERGRQIGAIVKVGTREFVAATLPGSSCGYYLLAPGRYFYFEPHATRNGKRYGPAQRPEYFQTEAERDAAIAKYLDGAKKRALRKETKRIEALLAKDAR